MPNDPSAEVPPLRERLRAALPAAMKRRDRNATKALRSALAAIDNAEAIDASHITAGAIEATPVGLGTAEAQRRLLTESDMERIVHQEITERLTTAAEYDQLARPAHASDLRAEAEELTRHLPTD
ncbi:GatB/YqeY domain-containing protein [Nocardia terpenica]|uniref:Glutamyl-tRNA amidotransferase n=1 Tax=Nocardia terpenica TaxID=455432 RepID=A0A6G9Z9J8_9NOCA|nr:GatB/YqeY domain-containing protein [Nocardia terpenica]QIS21693.1 hypothetical protein F6W96_28485 [Nocardia terpenica]